MFSINGHFKFEGWLMLALFLAPFAIGLLAAFVVPYVLTQVAVDRCLDSGGSYNYETELCVGATPR